LLVPSTYFIHSVFNIILYVHYMYPTTYFVPSPYIFAGRQNCILHFFEGNIGLLANGLEDILFEDDWTLAKFPATKTFFQKSTYVIILNMFHSFNLWHVLTCSVIVTRSKIKVQILHFTTRIAYNM
jgi:hypothetical protein